MKKRFLSAVMATALVVSLGLSLSADAIMTAPAREALAPTPALMSEKTKEDNMVLSEKLAEVTLKVKKTLGISDEYTTFNGDFNENILEGYWNLNWSNENEYLTVYADNNGKIMRYNRNANREYEVYDYYYNQNNFFAPVFAKVTKDQAKLAAEAFIKKVLVENETVELIDQEEYLSTTNVRSYNFRGVLKVNGLETTQSVSVSVSTSDKKVSSFSRSDQYGMNVYDFELPEKLSSSETAKKKLSSLLNFKLEYVLEYDKEDTTQQNPKAVLRYLPIAFGNWYVNAKSGELIDIDQLYKDILGDASNSDSAAENEAAAPEEGLSGSSKQDNGLTQVELEGIEKLEGVLNKEEIDSLIRKFTNFGVSVDFTLNSASYSKNADSDDITVYVNYSKRVTNPDDIAMTQKGFDEYQKNQNLLYIRKNFTLDAKTGEVKSTYTSYPYVPEEYKAEFKAADTKLAAEKFLKKQFGDKFAETALYDNQKYNSEKTMYYYGSNISDSYNYAQSKNGYFLAANNLNVNVNAINGSIDSFYANWVDNIAFDDAENLISKEKATQSYADAHIAKLSYLSLPFALDPSEPVYRPLIEYGYSYLFKYTLGYTFSSDPAVYAVDAKTGEAIKNETVDDKQEIKYEDIEKSEHKEKIEKLALYGITFGGSKFEAEKILSQKDMLVFLLTANGMRIDGSDESEANINNIYENAYAMKLLEKSERDEDKLITVAEMLKTLVSVTEYGSTAKLAGIFKIDFADEKDIPAQYYGEVAVAQGIKLIESGKDLNLKPNSTATRMDLALVLYNFMSR